MPWRGAGGQNIEHPHTPAILSSFFCFKSILVLLARHSSGKLFCSVTALIVHYLWNFDLNLANKGL